MTFLRHRGMSELCTGDQQQLGWNENEANPQPAFVVDVNRLRIEFNSCGAVSAAASERLERVIMYNIIGMPEISSRG